MRSVRVPLTLGLIAITFCCFRVAGQTSGPGKREKETGRFIGEFTSADWQKVHPAKAAFESPQAEAIPSLFALLDRDERVELTNTADLIYPGAKQFYGHGWILDYDVDWIPVRAGWALEQMAFQNFGFREGAINEADLLKAVIRGKEIPPLTSPDSPEAKRQRRSLAVKRAKEWWQQSGKSWNRFDAILEALRSGDPVRQFWTLNWIRSGKTKCAGLNRERFKKEIEPEVNRLLNSGTQGVRDEAKYVLEDRAYSWLKGK